MLWIATALGLVAAIFAAFAIGLHFLERQGARILRLIGDVRRSQKKHATNLQSR